MMDEVVKKHGIEKRIMLEIGNRVREIRTRLGHSMDSFAKLIGSTSATINNIEHGQSVPSGAILMKIFKACGVSADWILNGETTDQEHVKEATGTSIFFRGKWQIFSHLSNAYISEEERRIHDAIFSLLDSIQQLSEEEIALLQAVAEKFDKSKPDGE